jgi:hypothetical protein
MSNAEQTVIQHTKTWVEEVVIGLNLCPFASRPFLNDSIEYTVIAGDSTERHLQQLANSFKLLDDNSDIETSLLVYPEAYQTFDDYLDWLDYANHLLADLNYTGCYQLASFHPDYRFAGSEKNDASNFTNRSPYPMLHLIREKSLEAAITSYPDIEQVPKNNIRKLQEIGYAEMQKKLKAISS